jgi:tetratricopeptide (TPR) repeat protein
MKMAFMKKNFILGCMLVFMIFGSAGWAQENNYDQFEKPGPEREMKKQKRDGKRPDKRANDRRGDFKIPPEVRKAIKDLPKEKKDELFRMRELIDSYRELAMMERKNKNISQAVKWINEIKAVKIPDDMPGEISEFLEKSKNMINLFMFETYIEANDIESAEKYLLEALKTKIDPLPAAGICRMAANKFREAGKDDKAKEYLIKAVEFLKNK